MPAAPTLPSALPSPSLSFHVLTVFASQVSIRQDAPPSTSLCIDSRRDATHHKHSRLLPQPHRLIRAEAFLRPVLLTGAFVCLLFFLFFILYPLSSVLTTIIAGMLSVSIHRRAAISILAPLRRTSAAALDLKVHHGLTCRSPDEPSRVPEVLSAVAVSRSGQGSMDGCAAATLGAAICGGVHACPCVQSQENGFPYPLTGFRAFAVRAPLRHGLPAHTPSSAGVPSASFPLAPSLQLPLPALSSTTSTSSRGGAALRCAPVPVSLSSLCLKEEDGVDGAAALRDANEGERDGVESAHAQNEQSRRVVHGARSAGESWPIGSDVRAWRDFFGVVVDSETWFAVDALCPMGSGEKRGCVLGGDHAPCSGWNSRATVDSAYALRWRSRFEGKGTRG
ncbi:hypothetical protein C8R45DRAFT_1112805 [Mycena sanguinolenta]|nr:hypothetical protein C8R45DRAFT_1112805 [Mycena sanguinolenta]